MIPPPPRSTLFPYTSLFRSSYEYMERTRRAIASELPHLSAYFQSGGMVDAVLNQGLPAPIDVQLSGSDRKSTRLNSSHVSISYAVFCLKKKKHHSLISVFTH